MAERKAIEVSEDIRVVVDIDGGCFYERRGTDALGAARWEDVCPSLEAQADALREALCEVLFPEQAPPVVVEDVSEAVDAAAAPDAEGWRTTPLVDGYEGEQSELQWKNDGVHVCTWDERFGWVDRDGYAEPAGAKMCGMLVRWRYVMDKPSDKPNPPKHVTIQDAVLATLTDTSEHIAAIAARVEEVGITYEQTATALKKLAKKGEVERNGRRGYYRSPRHPSCRDCLNDARPRCEMDGDTLLEDVQMWQAANLGNLLYDARTCPGWADSEPAQQPLPTREAGTYRHLPALWPDAKCETWTRHYTALKAEGKDDSSAARIAHARVKVTT